MKEKDDEAQEKADNERMKPIGKNYIDKDGPEY